MAIIPNFFMNAVVAIGIDKPNGGKHWIGTGFIVGRKEKEEVNLSTYYIITNKHVIKEQSQIYIRFNSKKSFVRDYKVDLYDEKGQAQYSAHPHAKTDIVALQIMPKTLIDDQSIWGAFDLEDHSLTLQQMHETGVTEGGLIYSLGFPMNLVDEIKTPICRLGCVSRITDAFVLSKKGKPIYLVDAQAFPGNSGGPIINRPEPLSIEGTPTNQSANLIGILSDYIAYEDILISQQTEKAVMIQRENSGLTIVHPVDRIKEVVELEWERIEQLRIQKENENNESNDKDEN